jgi:hypothetical protein
MTAELPLEQSEKYPAELLLLGFSFARDVPRSVSISSIASLSAKTLGNVVGSADGDIVITPANPQFSGKRAQAYFGGGVAGETYKLICKVNMSDGQAPLEIHGLLYIKTV